MKKMLDRLTYETCGKIYAKTAQPFAEVDSYTVMVKFFTLAISSIRHRPLPVILAR